MQYHKQARLAIIYVDKIQNFFFLNMKTSILKSLLREDTDLQP